MITIESGGGGESWMADIGADSSTPNSAEINFG